MIQAADENGATTSWTPIDHVPSLPPLIGRYTQRYSSFDWDQARAWLDGLPNRGLNIAHEAVDRHATGSLADTVALRFIDRAGRDIGADLRTAAGAKPIDSPQRCVRLVSALATWSAHCWAACNSCMSLHWAH